MRCSIGNPNWKKSSSPTWNILGRYTYEFYKDLPFGVRSCEVATIWVPIAILEAPKSLAKAHHFVVWPWDGQGQRFWWKTRPSRLSKPWPQVLIPVENHGSMWWNSGFEKFLSPFHVQQSPIQSQFEQSLLTVQNGAQRTFSLLFPLFRLGRSAQISCAVRGPICDLISTDGSVSESIVCPFVWFSICLG